MNWMVVAVRILHELFFVLKAHEMLDGLLFTAIVCTMPVPGSPFNLRTLYTWFYDAVHQFWNLRNPRAPLPSITTEPAATEKK